MKPETIALVLVVLFVAIWLTTVISGMLSIFPYGLPALLVIGVVVYLFYKVIKDRLTNNEDNYYEKNIKD